MDFMNSTGDLLPIELCGLSLLYSRRYVSHFTCASANDKNQFWSTHSARTLPLKLSMKVFSVDLVGCDKPLQKSEDIHPNGSIFEPQTKDPVDGELPGPAPTAPEYQDQPPRPGCEPRALT